jgi:diguanylate cyclase (GGDEF)-like protein
MDSDLILASRKSTASLTPDVFTFIQDDRLQNVPTVKELTRSLEPARWDTPCLEVLDRFLENSGLYAIPVIDHERRPLALVDRNVFVEFFAKTFTRELFGRRQVYDVIHHADYRGHEPIVVEEESSIEDVAQIIISAGMHHMVTGFVVTREGRYAGVANGHDLLNLITQRKQAELFYLAHYDHLTGVPNRTLLGDRIKQACLDAERKGNMVALLFIDVDRFKTINDSLGHSFGDAVLHDLVMRLKASARKSDTVARIGGDEFVILMDNLAIPEDADIVAGRVLDAMRIPMELLGHSLVVTVSIGIAIFPRDDTDVSRLLAKADAAMYLAKEAGRDGFRVYAEGNALYDPSRLSLQNELRQAIENGELRLYFQPQVHIATRQICGVEALVRWPHPVRGMVSPSEFIPLAEESGLILKLGEWVLREACRQLNEWEAKGYTDMRMSINVSAVQFHQASFVEQLRSIVEESGVNPHNIELELTESVLMHNVGDVIETLTCVRALGVSLAIDDFGTGYSSLNYLRRFPINRLKIDQSFVRDIEHTPTNETIIKAIIALAASLSLDIVAEGIEKDSEQTVLEGLGCSEGQGYLFSRPLPALEITNLIEANSHGVASRSAQNEMQN